MKVCGGRGLEFNTDTFISGQCYINLLCKNINIIHKNMSHIRHSKHLSITRAVLDT